MKVTISIFSFLLFFLSGKTQADIKRIDSMVNVIEAMKNLFKVNECDTTVATSIIKEEIEYAFRYCNTYYYSNNEIFKIVVDAERTPIDSTFEFKDTISVHIFYFNRELLIKSIEKDFHNPVKILDQYYFSENDLNALKTVGEDTQSYKRAKAQIHFANELLNRFKKNKSK